MPIPDFRKILDSLPEKPPRSRLEPYRELILEMRRRGRPLREIVHVLGEKCGIHVVPSTVHDFVKAALLEDAPKDKTAIEENAKQNAVRARRSTNADQVEDRIAALKSRKLSDPKTPERFHFVSGEPLRIQKASKTPKAAVQ